MCFLLVWFDWFVLGSCFCCFFVVFFSVLGVSLWVLVVFVVFVGLLSNPYLGLLSNSAKESLYCLLFSVLV